MSKINKIKALLQDVLAQFTKLSTDKGLLTFDSEELQVGSVVALVDEEGNESPAESGEYKTEEGVVYVVEDSKVAEIREPEDEEPAAQVEEEMSEEAPAEPVEAAEEPAEPEVSKEAEEPAEEPAEAQEEAPVEEAPVELSVREKFSQIRMAFEATYSEKTVMISEAIRAKGYEAWVVEAADSYAIAEVWDEEAGDWKYRRFEVLWGEDGKPVIGAEMEVRPAFVPVNEEVEFSSMKSENEELRNKVAELEAQLEAPAAEPISQEFEKVTASSYKKGDDEKLDNLHRYFKN